MDGERSRKAQTAKKAQGATSRAKGQRHQMRPDIIIVPLPRAASLGCSRARPVQAMGDQRPVAWSCDVRMTKRGWLAPPFSVGRERGREGEWQSGREAERQKGKGASSTSPDLPPPIDSSPRSPSPRHKADMNTDSVAVTALSSPPFRPLPFALFAASPRSPAMHVPCP